MKNLQVNLFILLALGLCGLCARQWYEQTVQRDEIQTLDQMVYDRNAAIQGYTNSIATLNHQVNQMDASLAEIKAAAATNEQLVISQRVEITQLQFANNNFTNEIAQYKTAVDALEARVFEVVEATLEASGMDAETLEERVAEIAERMREGEWEYDYVERPIGAVIAAICEDLDIKPDWLAWADTDWAIEEAATAAPGSPYALGGAAWGEAAATNGPAEEPVREPVAADGSSP